MPLYLLCWLTHRFSISATSHDSLKHVRQFDSSSSRHKACIMSSCNTNHDSAISTAASDWKKETLDLLNIEYDFHSMIDFKFDALVLLNELQKGMTRFIKNVKSSNQLRRQESWTNQWFKGNNLWIQIQSISSFFNVTIQKILGWFLTDASQKFIT